MEQRGEELGLFCSPKLPFFKGHNVNNFVADCSFKRHFFGKISRSEQVN